MQTKFLRKIPWHSQEGLNNVNIDGLNIIMKKTEIVNMCWYMKYIYDSDKNRVKKMEEEIVNCITKERPLIFRNGNQRKEFITVSVQLEYSRVLVSPQSTLIS